MENVCVYIVLLVHLGVPILECGYIQKIISVAILSSLIVVHMDSYHSVGVDFQIRVSDRVMVVQLIRLFVKHGSLVVSVYFCYQCQY